MAELPIEAALPRLRTLLRSHTGLVLQAPPGAGKTTRVPLALLDEPWLEARRIVMLEPRRLAARAAATRMAATLSEPVGETVGYRVRMDTRVGPNTRIEVVTEGVLTRMLQSDATLEGVGVVVFDEFHERSLHADLGLALCLQARELLRDDLRVLVMSATLDGGPVADLLTAGSASGPAPVLTVEGRSHPVETRYSPRREEGWLEPRVARAVLGALREEEGGDLLVFLPGAGEIRRVEARLREERLPPEVRLAPLYGNLPQQAQERAIRPSAPGERKVVLATSIAETSLTIEGVRVVIDSGRMRVPRFDPRTGMSRLETVTVSRASADQRRGRAGRLGPGVCYRLWTEVEQRQLTPFSPPEILDADLAPLALELAVWGVSDPEELRWLDPPPAGAFAQARELLRELEALDARGTATLHGRRLAELPLHPRLGHMLLRAIPRGWGALACELAALLGERDPLRAEGAEPEADIRLRVDAIRAVRRGGGDRFAGYPVDRAVARRALTEAERLRRQLRVPAADDDPDAAGVLLALAYPDRIAQRRPGGGGRFLLRNGRGAVLPGAQALGAAEFLVAAELDGQGRESRILRAAPVERAELEGGLAEGIEQEATIAWDPEAQAVRARERERLGALVLREGPLLHPDPDRVTEALLDGVAREGLEILPWTRATRQLRERLLFLRRLDPARWPDVSDAALLASLHDWLRPSVHGARRREDLQRIDLAEALLFSLSWAERRELDEEAPTHLEVPSGSRVAVDYSDPEAPVLAVRLQELFGLRETPRVGRGRVPITLHLLSPARRPVQVTRDLASFWRGTYYEVRKDLKGRYPKHYWPDDPLQATPTRRTRPPDR